MPEKKHWRLTAGDTRYQMQMGIPMALQFAITSSGTMIMQSAINLFGSEAVAAYTAACKVHSLLTQGMVAMGQTMAVYSGQNYGKGDYGRIRAGVKAALIIEFIYSVVSAVACFSFIRSHTGAVFLRRRGSYSHDAMGKNLYYNMHFVLYSPQYDFYFPQYHAGLWLWILPMMGGVVELVARMLVAMIA